MQFGEAIQTGLSKYFVFRGRASRSEYWYFALFCFLVRVASSIGDLVILGVGLEPRIGFRILTGLLLLIPQMAVLVRRLHDTERPGWIVLGLIVLATTDLFVLDYYRNQDSAILTSIGAGALFAVSAILFIIQFVFLVTPGTQGDNEYGPDPLAQTN